MKRIWVVVAAMVVSSAGFFTASCVGQSASMGYGTAGAEGLSRHGEAAKPARTFVYDFSSQGAGFEAAIDDSLEGCPVAMEAKRLGGGDMVKVRGSADREPGQRIRLRLRETGGSARVIGARVAVRGTDGKPRMSTLASSGSKAGEVTRVVSLNFRDHGESWAAADLLLRGLTSVSRVKLESLSYADGTTWESKRGSSCVVAPDPLMLIVAR